MVEQSQDSSASTASSTVQPAGGAVSETESRPLHTAPPPTEGEGAVSGGVRYGGAVKHTAPHQSYRTQVLVRLGAGAAIAAVARDLGIHRKTVQQYRDALLSIGALVVVQVGKHGKGPAYAVELARGGAVSDRSPPRNPTAPPSAPWLMTDGRRVFEVLAAPKGHPSSFPGFAGTTLTGRSKNPAKKRQDHRFNWTLDGRTFDLLLMESPTAIGHGLSLQLSKVKPAPYLEAIQRPGEDKEDAWDRFASSAVQAWARLAGLAVGSAVRRSKPVSLALPGVVDADVKFRTKDTDADASPEKGTVETRTAVVKAFLDTGPGGGPQTQADHARRFEELREWRERTEAELSGMQADAHHITAVVGKTLAVLREFQGIAQQQTEALVAIAQTEAASLSPPLPKRVLSPDSGVDVS